MAAVDRELEITYGSLVIGGTTDVDGAERLINGFIQIDKSFDGLTVSFDFVIAKDTEAAFQDEIEAVELAFRTPFQDLEVKQGAETLIDCRPTTGSGLNTQPTITKSENVQFDTGRSRLYTVSIAAELPASAGVAPTTGIRESSINVSFTPARRRRVTISGVVTAIGTDSARTEYNAIIATYTAAVLAALGGTYELFEESAENDYDVGSGITGGALVNFSQTFSELIFDDAAGVADNPEIVGQSIKITRSHVGPGDTTGKNVSRLVTLTASYSAWIDRNQTTDIRQVWSDIKSWVYDQIRETLELGSIAVTDVSPTFDYDENQISASIIAFGTTGANILEFSETTQTADILGVVLVPAWEGPYSKYSYQGPATRRRTTTTTQRVLGSGGANAQGQNVARSNFSGPGGSGFQFGFGGSNPPGIGSLGPIGAQNSQFKSSFGFGQVNRSGFSFGPAGGGIGGSSNTSTGSVAAAAGLLAMQLDFVLISLTDSSTPLTIGTDGQTINVTDKTTVMVEEGFLEVNNKGGAGGGANTTGQASGARITPAPPP